MLNKNQYNQTKKDVANPTSFFLYINTLYNHFYLKCSTWNNRI